MVQSQKNSTPLQELIARALYGAEDDGEGEGSGDGESQEGDDNDGKGEGTTFDQAYVDSLRKESASRRIKAKESDARTQVLEKELAKIKQAEMDDLEKAQSNLETATETASTATARADAAESILLAEQVRFAVTIAAAEAGFEDPTDALSMISQDELVDDEGSISSKKVKARLKALADSKPYLLKAAGGGSGDGGPRGKPVDEKSFEAKKAAYLKEMTTTGGRVSA